MSRRSFWGLLTGAPVATRASKPALIVRSSRPLDLETPVEHFRHFLTPTSAFFIRSHHDAPAVDPKSWRLAVAGLVEHPLSLSLDELKALPRHTVTAVLQCSGNGRAFYAPKVPGVPWQRGAVGCAEWTGVRLADVLAKAGVKPGAAHVALGGADAPVLPATPRFGRSLPLAKALHPDTLLAYEMNGQPLPPLHGFPLRVVPPGWVGDDWVKWLTTLTVQAEEFQGFFVQTAYRYPIAPGKPGEPVPPTASRPMTTMVVKSLIAAPAQDARVKRAPTWVQGVAWTGGDARIVKVEVSADGGETWALAELFGEDRPYAWRQWRWRWTPGAAGRFALLSRATDSAGAVQPLGVSPWNPSGYQWNAADGVGVAVEG